MALKRVPANSLTGGGAGVLYSIDGDLLEDGAQAEVITDTFIIITVWALYLVSLL